MKLNLYTSALMLATTFLSCSISERKEEKETDKSASLLFPKGNKITNFNFTGTAYLQPLIAADSLNQISVGNVTFEPGARTKWHIHPAGQIILATAGKGFYQEKGSAKIIFRKGDVIKCPPNIPHWHGASSDSMFVQIAITGREKGEPIWLYPVSDEEYGK
jgi:quercetin dioxygenase-like cupin family protein